MKKIIASLGAVAALTLSNLGCQYETKECSDVLHEDATVIARIHTPAKHEKKTCLTAMNLGAMGRDYEGNMGIRIGSGLQISSSTIPERYGVLFQCEHGNFTTQGSEEKHKNLYERLKTNDLVDVTYKEVYNTIKDGTNIISRVLNDYWFLDAQTKTK
jgi:hypothetical protein